MRCISGKGHFELVALVRVLSVDVVLRINGLVKTKDSKSNPTATWSIPRATNVLLESRWFFCVTNVFEIVSCPDLHLICFK